MVGEEGGRSRCASELSFAPFGRDESNPLLLQALKPSLQQKNHLLSIDWKRWYLLPSSTKRKSVHVQVVNISGGSQEKGKLTRSFDSFELNRSWDSTTLEERSWEDGE